MATANSIATPAPATGIIYVRYSPRPDEACNSLETQEDYVRRYFSFLGVEVSEVISDPDTSARLTPLAKRRGGAKLLAMTSGPLPQCRIIGAYRLDRLWRDVVDGNVTMAAWRKSGVECHFAAEGGQALNTATATGRFIVNMLLSKAAYESDLTAERTSTSMLLHQKNGRRMSKIPPYGTIAGPDKTLLPCPEEQTVIGRIKSLAHRNGHSLSAYKIAKLLNEEGVFCRGRRWRYQTVEKVLGRSS